jgi:hypothetical protein
MPVLWMLGVWAFSCDTQIVASSKSVWNSVLSLSHKALGTHWTLLLLFDQVLAGESSPCLHRVLSTCCCARLSTLLPVSRTDFEAKASHHTLRTSEKRPSASQHILTSPNRHSHNINIYLSLSSIKATPSERLAWRSPNITVV